MFLGFIFLCRTDSSEHYIDCLEIILFPDGVESYRGKVGCAYCGKIDF